ncbi:PilW family protein [Thermodesulfobacteriota bacterium]
MGNEKGFTLSELLVAMVIALIVMASGYSMYMSQQKAYEITESVSGLQQNLRAAMFFLERELRMAGYNPTRATSGAFTFTNITATSVTFTTDSETEDGVLGTGETVTYSFNSADNTLRREAGSGGAQVVADNITGLSLVYLNKDGGTPASGADVRAVDVTLTAQEDTHTRQSSTRVRCRNMGL